MVTNATLITSKQLYGQPYMFSLLQLGWILLGSIGFIFFKNYNYHNLTAFSYILFFVSIVFLLFLGVISIFVPCGSDFIFTPCINGAYRWIYLNPQPLLQIPFLGTLSFQPGELVKLSLVLYLSFQISKNLDKNTNSFLVYMISTCLVSGLILLQPNMSTASILFVVGSIIYFVSGAGLKPVFISVPPMLILVAVTIFLSPYRRERVMTFLHGEESADLGSGYHVKQILIALGSGGLWGVGFGQSRQKYSYLPEVASDSIFAIIGEELGFVGLLVLLSTFGYLIYKGFMISKRSKDLLGRLLAMGIISSFTFQLLTNVMAMTKLIPLTGVPLPLISYGGSSMLFTLSGLGILANIEKNS